MKILRFLVILLIATLLVPVPTQATTILPANIELVGDAVELAFSETTDPGFVYSEAFLPGQSVQRTLTIRNTKAVPFRLSFELERSSSAMEADLLSQIDIQIYEGTTLLCSGVIDENNCDVRQLYATLLPGDVRTLTMIATFNQAAGNEYKNKTAQYDWIFDAVVTSTTTTGTPTKKPIVTTTGNPLVNTGVFALEMTIIGVGLFASGRYLIKRKKSD